MPDGGGAGGLGVVLSGGNVTLTATNVTARFNDVTGVSEGQVGGFKPRKQFLSGTRRVLLCSHFLCHDVFSTCHCSGACMPTCSVHAA